MIEKLPPSTTITHQIFSIPHVVENIMSYLSPIDKFKSLMICKAFIMAAASPKLRREMFRPDDIQRSERMGMGAVSAEHMDSPNSELHPIFQRLVFDHKQLQFSYTTKAGSHQIINDLSSLSGQLAISPSVKKVRIRMACTRLDPRFQTEPLPTQWWDIRNRNHPSGLSVLDVLSNTVSTVSCCDFY